MGKLEIMERVWRFCLGNQQDEFWDENRTPTTFFGIFLLLKIN